MVCSQVNAMHVAASYEWKAVEATGTYLLGSGEIPLTDLMDT